MRNFMYQTRSITFKIAVLCLCASGESVFRPSERFVFAISILHAKFYITFISPKHESISLRSESSPIPEALAEVFVVINLLHSYQ